MIKLGLIVKCKLTGFTGVATQRLEKLCGSTQLFVEGRDNGFRRDEWLDEGRLILAEEKPVASVSTIIPVVARPPE